MEHFFPDKRTFEKSNGEFTYIPSTNKNATLLHVCYKHNPYCDQETKDHFEILKEKRPDSYKVNALGLIGNPYKGAEFRNIFTSFVWVAD